MQLQKIDILSIPVSDQDIAKDFYTDILGFEVVADNPMGPGQRWVQLRPPAGETSITLVTWFDDFPAGAARGTVIDTLDIKAAHAALLDKGLEISAIDHTPVGSFATFKDPDGNGWVVQQAQA